MLLFQWMAYDDAAQPLTTTFAEYLLPSATEVPDIEFKPLDFPTPLNPLGVKGVGEVGCVPAGAAIISAVENALEPFGIRIAEIPLLPPRLFSLMASVRHGAYANTGSNTYRAGEDAITKTGAVIPSSA